MLLYPDILVNLTSMNCIYESLTESGVVVVWANSVFSQNVTMNAFFSHKQLTDTEEDIDPKTINNTTTNSTIDDDNTTVSSSAIDTVNIDDNPTTSNNIITTINNTNTIDAVDMNQHGRSEQSSSSDEEEEENFEYNDDWFKESVWTFLGKLNLQSNAYVVADQRITVNGISSTDFTCNLNFFQKKTSSRQTFEFKSVCVLQLQPNMILT